MPKVLFVFILSVVFFLMFAYLRWGMRSWHETTGRIVDRTNALKSKTSYPIVEYTDKEGRTQRGEANRVAFWYPSDTVRIRVSSEGVVHVKGVELVPLSMSVLFLAIVIIQLAS